MRDLNKIKTLIEFKSKRRTLQDIKDIEKILAWLQLNCIMQGDIGLPKPSIVSIK